MKKFKTKKQLKDEIKRLISLLKTSKLENGKWYTDKTIDKP